jgi:hypothetical protein
LQMCFFLRCVDKKDANSIFVFHVYHPAPMLYESKR